MLGSLGRRAVEAIVALFALLGFFLVPLGHKTGFEHAKAVFSTPAAGRAASEIAQAVVGLRARLVGGVPPTSPDEPTPKGGAGPRRSGPAPTPPKLN